MVLHAMVPETGLSCCLMLLFLQVVDLAACEFEPGSASRVMLGRESGGMIVYDLEAQKPAAKVSWAAGSAPCTYASIMLSSSKKLIRHSAHCFALHCIALQCHCTACMLCSAVLCCIPQCGITLHCIASLCHQDCRQKLPRVLVLHEVHEQELHPPC